jgi:hypothetical protein
MLAEDDEGKAIVAVSKNKPCGMRSKSQNSVEQKRRSNSVVESKRGLSSVAITVSGRRSTDTVSPRSRELGSSYRVRALSQHSDSFELKVNFKDLNESRRYIQLETDTIALLLHDIIASRVYPDTLQIWQLEFSIDGKVMSANDWNKKLSYAIKSQDSELIVYRRKDAQPPYMNEKMTKKDIYTLYSDMIMSWQERLKREKELRKMSVKLSQILANLPDHFKTVLIDALNESEDAAKDANELQMVVIFCFQDFLSKDNKPRHEFMGALANVIFKSNKTNHKLNALRILVKWIQNFRGRDFPVHGESAKLQTIKLLKQYYEPILEHFDRDEDFKSLQDFHNIRKMMPRMRDLENGRLPRGVHTKNIKLPSKNMQWQVKADYIYKKSLTLFDSLDAGDFANCKHKVRRSQKSIKEMTNFTNYTSLVVAGEILKGDDASLRGELIDDWIRIAGYLLTSRDYHSAQGVVGGLSLSCIYRLKKSWEFAKNGSMLRIVQNRLNNNNYADQRGALLKSVDKDDDAYKQKVIPFLGMIQKDLEKVDQIPKLLDDGSINRRKYLLVAKCVSNVIKQKDFKARPAERPVMRYRQIYADMEKLYKDAEQEDQKTESFDKLDEKADEYVKIERGQMLCNQSVRSKLVTLTLMNVLTWVLVWCMFLVYILDSKSAYTMWHLGLFVLGCLLSCFITRITIFEFEVEEDLNQIGGTEDDNRESKSCSKSRIISYLFDMIGLGILPAFWRAWKVNMMYENIYGHIDSWKKEFSLQNSVTMVGLQLPLVTLFLYTNVRNLYITKMRNYMVLILPLITISFTIFHLFRGAHETIFLVSGRTIVIAGFISLLTDFLIRVTSVLALLSWFLRAAKCIDENFACIEEEIEHGEGFCAEHPIGSDIRNWCCECEGGEYPTDEQELMYKLYATLLFVIVFVYEFGWVLFFHHRYNKKEDQLVHVENDISGWKKFLMKMLQALLLMVTFSIINIPVLGMYRPKYRQVEQCIRVILSISMVIMFLMWDNLIEDFSIWLAIGIVIPIHIIAYIFFEMAFHQKEGQGSTLSQGFEYMKFQTERMSFLPGRAKELLSFSTATVSNSDMDLSIAVTASESKEQDTSHVELIKTNEGLRQTGSQSTEIKVNRASMSAGDEQNV